MISPQRDQSHPPSVWHVCVNAWNCGHASSAHALLLNNHRSAAAHALLLNLHHAAVSHLLLTNRSSAVVQVNGLATPRTVLRPGDEIAIGPQRFRFDGQGFYVKSGEEMLELFVRITTVIEGWLKGQTLIAFIVGVLTWAGLPVPPAWQGRSFADCLRGQAPADWRDAMYYRYWMHKDGSHNVWSHYGLRTRHHKLIHYYADPLDANPAGGHKPGRDRARERPEWELFDLRKDPLELQSVYHDPDYADIRERLTARLHAEQAAVGDVPWSEAESARCAALG